MSTPTTILSPTDAEWQFITGDRNPAWRPRAGTLATNVLVANAREVLRQLGLAESIEAFFEFVDGRWSFGDTAHTLVGPRDFIDALSAFLSEHDEDLAVFWSPVLDVRFWTMVGTAGFLDIEGE